MLLKINKKETALEEINKEKLIISEKVQQAKDIKKNILLIESIITKESREIVSIKKIISKKNKENSLLKNKYENYRIEFEINKKQMDEETIRKEKIEEEINATQKQIKNTQGILLTLSDDVKKADYEENLLLTKPNDSEIKIKELENNMDLNKEKLNTLEATIRDKKSKLEIILEKYQNTKIKRDALKRE